MKRISVLQANTIDQIAAGEVVASPSSVVKELVENSLDAQATVIEVEIAEGGLSLVSVADNGGGIYAEDCIKALLRHATSKIQAIDDLYDLYTMGFRGEALASVASVSKLTLHSAQEGFVGVKIYSEGGAVLTHKKEARQKGTTVTVQDLFYNVPARRKFQRKSSALAVEIYRTFAVLSLASPHVTFLLRSEKGVLLELPSVCATHQKGQLARIQQVLGEGFLQGGVSVEKKVGPGTITGILGGASLARRNRLGQYLFVNQRPVTCQFIEDAVRQGFGTMLGSRDHPSFVLYVQVPPSSVDVNVHPQKQEVRFKDERGWHGEFVQSISEVLYSSMEQVAELPERVAGEAAGFVEDAGEDKNRSSTQNMATPAVCLNQQICGEGVAIEKAPPHCAEKALIKNPFEAVTVTTEGKQVKWLENINLQEQELPPLVTPVQKELSSSDPLVLMGLFGQYLFLQKALEGIFIVDMRAARFRIMFDALQKEHEGGVQKQILFFPLEFSWGNSDVLCLLENKKSLEQVGFSLRQSCANTISVGAIPPFLQENQIGEVLEEILASLLCLEGNAAIKKEKDTKVAFIAAQHACRGGVSSAEEGMLLYKRLLEEKHSLLDPKGNKIIRRLQHEEIQKLFC